MSKAKRKQRNNGKVCAKLNRLNVINDRFDDDGTFEFVSDYVWSSNVSKELLKKCNFSPSDAITSRGCKRSNYRMFRLKNKKVAIWKIVNESHPTHGQHGLFANKKIAPNEHIIDYVGLVEMNAFESKTSDYIIHFVDDLSCDAEKIGNEARFINDYRNISENAPNVKFLNYTNKENQLRLGVFCGSKCTKKNQELLVSYGKGFWKARK